MFVHDVQKAIEESLGYFNVPDKEMYALPWKATRTTNKLRALKEDGLLPSGVGGRHAKKLTAEQVGLVLLTSMLGTVEPDKILDKVRLYAGLKLAGEKTLKIPLIRRLEIALADPNEAAKLDRLTIEQTFPYAVLDGDMGREVYTLGGDETKIPPVTGSGMGAYVGHTVLVELAQRLQGPVNSGWTGKSFGSVEVPVFGGQEKAEHDE